MSKQETPTEKYNLKAKQPIGSSKRKRKSSTIKHNVISSNSLDADENGGSKPVRQIKKMKSERCKSGREKTNVKVMEITINSSLNGKSDAILDGENSLMENQNMSLENIKSRDKNDASFDTQDEILSTKAIDKTKFVSDMEDKKIQCTKKQQCQNQKFREEDKIENVDKDIKPEYGTKMYTCKICAEFGLKRIYSSAEKFNNHTKEAHEVKKDTKRFECMDCPEPVWFPTKSKLCYHLGTKHSGIIRFICEVCTQTFKLKANYKNHIKIHNIIVQKKFSCEVCGGTFVNRAGYESHKQRFPGPHIKQSCTHCGISFSREKHMKNHRCKKLLLEEAAAAATKDSNKSAENDKTEKLNEEEQPRQEMKELTDGLENQIVMTDKKNTEEYVSDTEQQQQQQQQQQPLANKKQSTEGDAPGGKRVLLHRLLPKKNEKLIYRQFPLQTQNVPQSVVVQEFREIDLEGGAFITAEPDHQIILRDVNGHLVQGNQILQLDINDFQPGEESQVYLADWNVVAPFVIRGKSP